MVRSAHEFRPVMKFSPPTPDLAPAADWKPDLTGQLRLVSDDFQLLIQSLVGNRHGGAKFLREQRNLELFNHPPKGFDQTLRFG
jgi:hypothetical protein